MVSITTLTSVVECLPKRTWPMSKPRCAKSLQQTSHLCELTFQLLMLSNSLVNNRINAKSLSASPEAQPMAPTALRSAAQVIQSAFIATPTNSLTSASDLTFRALADSDTSNCKRFRRRIGAGTKKVQFYNVFTEQLGRARQLSKNISTGLKKPSVAITAASRLSLTCCHSRPNLVGDLRCGIPKVPLCGN